MRHALVMMVAAAPAALACGMGGPEAELDALLLEHEQRTQAGETASLAALESRIDAVAGAKDAVFSGLYWHRDLEQAKRAAEQTARPILSLRLLGDLTCDKSCANSRFFRTALYANQELAAWLRRNVVLHWESVRPVPVIVIDMGDGRRIERTVTGNSIHYLTLPDGTVVDALPGLYGPQAFLEALRPAVELAQAALTRPAAERAGLIRRHQVVTARRLQAAADAAGLVREQGQTQVGAPSAGEAAPRAMGKAMVERPLLVALGDTPAPEDPVWDRLAERWLARCKLDASSQRLVLRKSAPSLRGERAQAELIARFERLMARDTALNELRFRPQILSWLAQGAANDLRGLNRRVYAELFLTPEEDPWLGLAPRGDYAALENAGLIER